MYSEWQEILKEDFTEPELVLRDTLGAVTIILFVVLLVITLKGGASNDK